jgi:hypothetical protein
MKALLISLDLIDGNGVREGCRAEIELPDDFDGASIEVGLKAAVWEIDYLKAMHEIRQRKEKRNGTKQAD